MSNEKHNWLIANTYEDLGVHIRVRPYNNIAYDDKCCVVEFEVFGLHEIGDVDKKLTWKFQKKNSNFSPDSVDSADEAETLITGYIKFDGCCNVNFGDARGYIHGCERQDMTRMGQIFEYLYDIAQELMPNHCM